MDIYKLLKENINSIDVAKKYLGNPDKQASNSLWYKSPFRNERTASFQVKEKFMYDYGSSTYYSIIDFCMKLWGIDVHTTAKTLASDFNINIDNNMTSEEINKVKKAQAQRKMEEQQKEKWFKDSFIALTNLYDKTKDIIKNSNINNLTEDTCSLQNKLERILEVDSNKKSGSFIVSSKEELYRRYKDLDFTDKNKILKYVDIVFEDLVERDFCLNNYSVEQEETEEEAI